MTWEIESRGIKDEMLKEAGPNGRWLFRIQEMPGLGRDAVPIRRAIMAAPDLRNALGTALGLITKHGLAVSLAESHPEDFARLEAARAAFAKAVGTEA